MPNNLMKRIEQFLQQKQDYIWFTSSCNTQNGRNHRKAPRATERVSNISTKANDQERSQEYYERQLAPNNNWRVSSKGNFQEAEQDSFEERVVYTTFPIGLDDADFYEYIDRKFSNLNVSIREQMKGLLKVKNDADMEQNVFLAAEPDGSMTATLIQMLLERNTSFNELKISVGYVKFTRKSEQYRDQIRDDWETNRDRVVKALQYKYGVQLKRELS